MHVAGEILETTAEHPFFVFGKGWKAAFELEIGDLLMTCAGLLVPVEGVADSGRVEPVYNWRIAEYHTYFVSASEDGASVWCITQAIPPVPITGTATVAPNRITSTSLWIQ